MPVRPCAAALLLALAFAACGGGDSGSPASTSPSATATTAAVTGPTTPNGLQTGPPPWPPEYAHLKGRLVADGIPALRVEGTAVDLHVYLLIAVHGRAVTVPAHIGVHGTEQGGRIVGPGFVSPLHTHDATGLIHVHSTEKRTYTVGEIFDVWGVRFTDQCIGTACTDATNQLSVYVDGKKLTGDPRQEPLGNLDVIVVVFGSPDETPSSIPSKFPGT